MGLLTFIADLRAAGLTDDLSKQVTRSVSGRLRQACAGRITQFTQAEARGYLWAKARPMITREVAIIARVQPMLTPTTLSIVSEHSHDSVVATVLGEVLQSRTQPAIHRRAA